MFRRALFICFAVTISAFAQNPFDYPINGSRNGQSVTRTTKQPPRSATSVAKRRSSQPARKTDVADPVMSAQASSPRTMADAPAKSGYNPYDGQSTGARNEEETVHVPQRPVADRRISTSLPPGYKASRGAASNRPTTGHATAFGMGSRMPVPPNLRAPFRMPPDPRIYGVSRSGGG